MTDLLCVLIIFLFGFCVGSLAVIFRKTTHETTKRLEPTSIKITNLGGKVDTTYICDLKNIK